MIFEYFFLQKATEPSEADLMETIEYDMDEQGKRKKERSTVKFLVVLRNV